MAPDDSPVVEPTAGGAAMTTADLAKRIGTRCLVRFEEVWVLCRIRNAWSSYGHTRFEVAPIGGEGSQKVDAKRVKAVK